MTKMSNSIRISLCGDVLQTRRFPKGNIETLAEIKTFLHQHDCRFANLETTIHCNEGYPEAFPGGGYAMAEPRCLEDLKSLGFNLFSTANNHAMDYSHKGLLATIKYLNEFDIPFAGTGENLSAASRATFLDVPNGRIAMLSVTSSFHDSYAAGAQNMDMQGRPGVAPLRHKAIYEIDEIKYKQLSIIESELGFNNYYNRAIKTGYLTENKHLKFGGLNFICGTENKVHTHPNDLDIERTVNAIKDAKFRSDLVIVSVHSHQFLGDNAQVPPQFIREFSHKCIESGANIIVCHGPHILRGIEAYKSGVIFHGLGNFIFQHEDTNILPEDFYIKYGYSRETTSGVGDIMNIRSKNNTIGLHKEDEVWESMIVSLECCDNAMEIKIFPIGVSNDKRGKRGLPYFSNNESTLKRISELSLFFNTKIDIAKNIGRLIIHKS